MINIFKCKSISGKKTLVLKRSIYMDLFYAAFMNLTFNGQKPLSLHYNYLNLCVSMMNKGLKCLE